MKEAKILQGYEYAREVYGELGVDVDAAIQKADNIPVSMHCWQGDDLIGFDGIGKLTGGIAATGSYPGRATTADELRRDIGLALEQIPGKTKLNLHSCYAELEGKKVDRDQYTVEHFSNWLYWAKDKKLGMDFNPTFFSHPRMDGDFSLSSRDESIRRFWIEHGKRCREIGCEFGKVLGQTCVVNYWMPDGYKDIPADTATHRELMTQSLDEIFQDKLDEKYVVEAVESKLFGLGVESYTVASHEYSLGYCISRNKVYCLDAGHFHPTECISEKISAVVQFLDKVLLHLSRGVRWDSDHVVVWDDELQKIMDEVISGGFENRVYIAQDYFDASINRIACWVIAMRNTRKALLKAVTDPRKAIKQAEINGDYTSRLALMEENKSLPFSLIWDYYCMTRDVPMGRQWIYNIKEYERKVLSMR
jgi:L-rhamnose isomerase